MSDLEDEFEELEVDDGQKSARKNKLAEFVDDFWKTYSNHIRLMFVSAVITGVHVFYVFAAIYNFHRSLVLLAVIIFGYCYFFNKFIGSPLYARTKDEVSRAGEILGRITGFKIKGVPILTSLFYVLVLGGFIAWLVIDARHNTIRYRSFFAVLGYILIGFLVSANPARVKWTPVFGGFFLQIAVAFLVLRWETGNKGFKFLADNVVTFLDYSVNGTTFVYGFIAAPPPICGMGSVFIYTSLQIIIYFGAVVAVLYYLGIIQALLSFIAFVMQRTVGTTAAESLNAAACIFLGQTEAAILIEPALATMTESEIHSVMTAGFACIAGSLFSAYISFGACPTYLLSATVMSAAVSLAISKLIYPEIQISKQKQPGGFQFKTRESNNILECISNGACHASGFVFAIGANLIVYIAILYMGNAWAAFIGNMLGQSDWSIDKLMGYLFFPLAYMMGASDAKDHQTEIEETLRVAELMGMKTILNEFIAYSKLQEMVADGRLTGARARMIATYALCGFSNISMIGSQLGILGAMCPKRKTTFAKVVIRALISGCISCFVTASVAGMLVDVPEACTGLAGFSCLNMRDVNATLSPYI